MFSAAAGTREYDAAAGNISGISGRALLGWMNQEEAIRFLIDDCCFSPRLTCSSARDIWEAKKAIVENLQIEAPLPPPRNLPMSAADLKAIGKFRKKYPAAEFVVDFVRLNPMDLVVHQLWISPSIAQRYREGLTADKWLQFAFLDPPSSSWLNCRRDANTVTFDLPHSEFILAGPLQPHGELRVTEAESFITVQLHAGQALLLRGYHRTFACARFTREAANAPRGVLFGVSNYFALLDGETNTAAATMELTRPPRMADFFDERLYLPVTLRKRRYEMRISCEVVEIDEREPQDKGHARNGRPSAAAPDIMPGPGSNLKRIVDEAVRQEKAGGINEAVVAWKRAAFLKPDNAGIHINLSAALLAQGNAADAATHAERALILDPDSPNAHNNLGFALAAQGRIDDAMTEYDRELARDRHHAAALNNKGLILKEQGRFDAAMACYGQAIAAEPDFAEAHFNRAEIETFHPGSPNMAALERLVSRNDLSVSQAIYANFGLAKALDDAEEYSRAFEHFQKANSLKRRQIKYDEVSALESFRRVSSVFDANLLDRHAGAGEIASAPVFVVGMPRSGSSLVEQILASHPQVHGAGELNDLESATRSVLNSIDRSYRFPDAIAALDAAGLRHIGQDYLARIPVLGNGTIRIIDKMPDNFFRIGLIRMILPNARIVHTIRNPMDTCLSCYSKLFTYAQYFSYDLAELGRYYASYKMLMAHWSAVLPPGTMLDVVYEDVVDDLEGQARRLIDYCGLPWDDRCLSFHRTRRIVRTASAVQVRQPLFRSSIERWRKYEAWLRPLLEELRDIVPGDASNALTRSSHVGIF
jgi:tetratricopeptide (TPR) repeat protein